jgi:hypothetical protein
MSETEFFLEQLVGYRGTSGHLSALILRNDWPQEPRMHLLSDSLALELKEIAHE